ncbi:MAG: hypothetical protein V1737_04915 [Chloroflexota bacterium]
MVGAAAQELPELEPEDGDVGFRPLNAGGLEVAPVGLVQDPAVEAVLAGVLVSWLSASAGHSISFP